MSVRKSWHFMNIHHIYVLYKHSSIWNILWSRLGFDVLLFQQLSFLFLGKCVRLMRSGSFVFECVNKYTKWKFHVRRIVAVVLGRRLILESCKFMIIYWFRPNPNIGCRLDQMVVSGSSAGLRLCSQMFFHWHVAHPYTIYGYACHQLQIPLHYISHARWTCIHV